VSPGAIVDALDGPSDGRKGQRTSAVLVRFLDTFQRDRISVADLATALGERAYGFLLLAFALPNVAPIVPPGLSAVLGVPLMLLSLQLAYGHPTPWFPKMISERSFARQDFARMLDRVLPYLQQVERLLRPRWTFLLGWNGERLVGFVCLILAIVLSLPILLGNILPSIAISILGLAVVEKDGLAAALGYIMALVSFVVVAAVLIALAEAFVFFLARAFS
jgi:hypothetical protein